MKYLISPPIINSATMAATKAEFMLLLILNVIIMQRLAESGVPQQEVEAVGNILASMNATSWRFDGDDCSLHMVSEVPKPSQEANASIGCDCNIGNHTDDCHVVWITHQFYSLDGVLSPELVKLPYLWSIDFAYNYLSGTIPPEWGSTTLQEISLLGNRLTGSIPPELGNITTLTKLNFEANQLSGTIPSELGRLTNLKTLILSSNRLTGRLPTTLGQLGNLTEFRIKENNFSGSIPDFIQNWRLLTRLEMVASGLTGPIPSNISLLENLTDLRIGEITGPAQAFPQLNNTHGLIRLILRNCNISGEIPEYIWLMRELEVLDLSFNRLVGRISNNIVGWTLRFVFLTANMLSGDIPDTLLLNGATIDFSYNNFTWQGPDQATCRQNQNYYVNIFRSSSTGKPMHDMLPCTENIKGPRSACSLHVNCGGNDLAVRENEQSVLYEGDANVDGGAARLYKAARNWGLSSTGDFMDDNNFQNARYAESLQGNTRLPALYTTARLSPLTLTYFSYCLENGEYSVKLHFAEIQFTNDSTYKSLGRRIFDIYIQGRRVRKDFNIEDEAGGVGRPVVVPFNASVTVSILEIRFYWAGKGTTRFPKAGVYGPLVSAIDVDLHFKTCSMGGKKSNKAVYIGVGIAVPFLIFLILVVLWRKKCFKGRKANDKDFEGMELKTISFSLKQLKTATNNFKDSNKIGEGGFGAVYKGTLSDGTVVAVKQLSSHSKQGNREFLNEIGVISCLQHPNLVKLHGCCIEGDQLLLVYEYMENNSLANALFGKSGLTLDWPTRFRICIGIARGLAFLHDESRIKIVHRDIKATNVLLDKDLNPKISDFGLARLNEDDKTHVSTRVAGTIGYIAPEYALRGHLSDKADVYSYGVLLLEIISGKNNTSYIPINNCICLLDWACRVETSKQYEELFDKRLESAINKQEAETVVKVALLCTNGSPSMRPTMTEVVNMLDGRTHVPKIVPERTDNSEDLRFKVMRDFRSGEGSQTVGQTQYSNTNRSDANYSLTSNDDAFEIRSVDTRSY
ncbi:putative protein kinase RLK-Pelle-DLSV family [Helianthus annuus]|uniref:non-specific serine/threonine protein kinase n=1 Tax=Helianthus annuus TaxID=4232 RepID=A0A251RVL5_HELAN|nr:probable LRR receptor-like serine/threonine-protein kinase RFK1 isoform X2 [Helianthus annuus]KAJ0451422.1 putative protein kinase RLK-Pelle-DLSV family [Helianthus annuus]KAJ0455921.1 putative protein kinase RLK-Pelle-DLSV family [Helianthus annuus]KAJ0473293.1 putative protein kinase RLK-Pelle-DLSV family [Helianthus annuus]KAJ0648876.1 putative protein kinase RLK-Pelle-DLSV family [Helianthus annuus]